VGGWVSPRTGFAEELIGRVHRAGAPGEELLRTELAFWNNALMRRLQNAEWSYSVTNRCQKGVVERSSRRSHVDTRAHHPELRSGRRVTVCRPQHHVRPRDLPTYGIIYERATDSSTVRSSSLGSIRYGPCLGLGSAVPSQEDRTPRTTPPGR
jgi:hypothetical protein